MWCVDADEANFSNMKRVTFAEVLELVIVEGQVGG